MSLGQASLFKALALPLGLLACVLGASGAEPSLSLREGSGARVEILSPAGETLMALSGLRFANRDNALRSNGGSVVERAPGYLKIRYKLVGEGASAWSLLGEFKATGLSVEETLVLSSDTADSVAGLGHPMLIRAGQRMEASRLVKAGLWTRSNPDACPYEAADGVYRRFDGASFSILERITGNSNWCDGFSQSTGLEPDGKGRYLVKTSFHAFPASLSDAAAAAFAKGRPLSLRFVSGAPFNIWPLSGKPSVKLVAEGCKLDAPSSVELSFFVKDFDGRTLLEAKRQANLSSGGAIELPVEPPVAGIHGVYFVEASAKAGSFQALARTNLAVMRDYEFKGKGSGLFGLAAYFELPDHDSVMALLKRLGVSWLRSRDCRMSEREIGAQANLHNNKPLARDAESGKKGDVSGEARTKWIKEQLAKADLQENPYWEFGNEWNMAKLNSGESSDVYAKDWLPEIDALRKAGGHKVKLLSMGIAGGDVAFLKGVYKNGGWPYIDGVAFHPGRGNFAPDCESGNFWTYLGAVRNVKKAVAKFGEKPLWITEAYAPTPPDHTWGDTVRQTAENVVLTYALGMAEGVKCVMFYQLNDGVWHDVGGVDSKDKEYHYGMLWRDLSPKPSILAYAATAEALDCASFVRYLNFEDLDLRGILFSAPKGPLAILWSRADGYLLSKKGEKGYFSPEPWAQYWKTKTEAEFSCPSGEAEIVDVIGRRRVMKAETGKLKLSLSGEPVMVYGLEFK